MINRHGTSLHKNVKIDYAQATIDIFPNLRNPYSKNGFVSIMIILIKFIFSFIFILIYFEFRKPFTIQVILLDIFLGV